VGRDLNDHIDFVGDLFARAYSIQVHVLASANCRIKNGATEKASYSNSVMPKTESAHDSQTGAVVYNVLAGCFSVCINSL
jgi:hypothetical protein